MKEKLEIKSERYFSLFYGNGTYIEYSLRNENGVLLSSLRVEVESIRKKEKYLCEYKDKKVLLISCFNTLSKFRGKGYGRYLLNAVLNHLKGECDIVHLDACPYYERGYKVTYRAYGNALNKKKLIEFYISLGFTKYGKFKEDGYNCYTMILQMKKG